MKIRLILLTTFFYAACLFSVGYADSQDFTVTEIADKVFEIKDTVYGEKQIVIASSEGLVVLNSFSSQLTAQRFKAAIGDLLKRDDFFYLINIVDRLDRCGGNGAYEGIPITGHKGFWDKYKDNDSAVTAEVNGMIEMWRWKETVARERMPEHEPGSERAIGEQKWINTCQKRAEELESGFSLVLPTETYEDRKTLELGDVTLSLIWFGTAGGDASTIIKIPELRLAILPDDLLSPLHLAPYPHPRFKKLDIARWIQVLEELLEGENQVENVLLCDFLNVVWSRDRAHLHLDYIRRLWNAVRKADSEGKSLSETYEQLSLENDFAFVKQMPLYLDRGDQWVRPQHNGHIKLFFLQGKTVASAIIEEALPDSLSLALSQIRRLRAEGTDVYIEEAALNAIGYYLLNEEQYAEAIEVFELNVEEFPESFNVYDSYAEALMKSGDIDNAIINYGKSLELNPENDNARQMLEALEKQ
ncbi:MAG: hypothetical protein JSU74_12505 [Candidatus Zixiibacteriota bacterium]|nr:MAG: hypothetical protein JSU74_12505 [candidate division Zixibacteria bacterium]